MRKTVDGTFKDVLQKAKICGAAEGENNPFKMLRYVDGRNTMLMGLNKQEKIMVQKTKGEGGGRGGRWVWLGCGRTVGRKCRQL